MNEWPFHKSFIQMSTKNVLVQVHLATDKLGMSVDECDALLKKHEAFERLITSQEEKVSRHDTYIHCIRTGNEA